MNLSKLPAILAWRRLILLRLIFWTNGRCSSFMSIACLTMLLLLGVVGCSPVLLTDVTAVSAPGRHEVSLAGSGVTLGGILFRPASHIETAAGDHRAPRLGATRRVGSPSSRSHGTTAFGTRLRCAGAFPARMAALRRLGRLRQAATRRYRESRRLAGNPPRS